VRLNVRTNNVILVSGDESFEDLESMKKVLDSHGPAYLVFGDSKGAEALARIYAEQNHIPFLLYPTNYRERPGRALYLRCRKIIDSAEIRLVILFGKTEGGPGDWIYKEAMRTKLRTILVSGDGMSAETEWLVGPLAKEPANDD
jgi:hypothetical protein